MGFFGTTLCLGYSGIESQRIGR